MTAANTDTAKRTGSGAKAKVKTRAGGGGKKKTVAKENLDTHIAVVLDRSGSMWSCQKSTIEGFNTFVNEQRELKDGGKASVTLVQFDDKYEIWDDNVSVEEFKYLDPGRYVPRGGTALNDAIGRTISYMDAWVQEHNWTGRVLFLIITDGEENASKEFGGPQGLSRIATLIEDHEKNAGWNFAFMGASPNTFAVSANYNIQAGATQQYNADPAGTAQNFAAMSMSTSSYRSSGARGVKASASYFDEKKTQIREKTVDNSTESN